MGCISAGYFRQVLGFDSHVSPQERPLGNRVSGLKKQWKGDTCCRIFLIGFGRIWRSVDREEIFWLLLQRGRGSLGGKVERGGGRVSG